MSPPGGAGDRGYALLVLLMLATVLLISLTAALPSIYTQGQREREEELIFRGNQYARAIAMFRRQFQRFPTSTKELLETNGFRFLRREFPDPMTRHGKWRFIHADASGTPIDSRTLTPAKPPSALGDDKSSSSSTGTTGAEQPSAEDEEEPKEKSAFFGDGKEVKGTFIIGVASRSNKNSIRVYNNKTRYSDWEFLGVGQAVGGVVPGQGAGVHGGAQQGRPATGRQGFPVMPPLTERPIPTQ